LLRDLGCVGVSDGGRTSRGEGRQTGKEDLHLITILKYI
jgi:hypothetical protein